VLVIQHCLCDLFMFDHPLDSNSYLILGISSTWEIEK
jgi:hypothetical protein